MANLDSVTPSEPSKEQIELTGYKKPSGISGHNVTAIGDLSVPGKNPELTEAAQKAAEQGKTIANLNQPSETVTTPTPKKDAELQNISKDIEHTKSIFSFSVLGDAIQKFLKWIAGASKESIEENKKTIDELISDAKSALKEIEKGLELRGRAVNPKDEEKKNKIILKLKMLEAAKKGDATYYDSYFTQYLNSAKEVIDLQKHLGQYYAKDNPERIAELQEKMKNLQDEFAAYDKLMSIYSKESEENVYRKAMGNIIKGDFEKIGHQDIFSILQLPDKQLTNTFIELFFTKQQELTRQYFNTPQEKDKKLKEQITHMNQIAKHVIYSSDANTYGINKQVIQDFNNDRWRLYSQPMYNVIGMYPDQHKDFIPPYSEA